MSVKEFLIILVVGAMVASAIVLIPALVRHEPSVVSGLDIEEAPAGSVIKHHLDGTPFWSLTIDRGECFYYKDKKRCLPAGPSLQSGVDAFIGIKR
jgi:hypothetical protein